ncbi:MAG TPA: tetratricopeptide repeat protein [Acidobacteriaceae bacterium]|nr:tetratricopeptide repeat protein [Acidobacteriaceae bacterium]
MKKYVGLLFAGALFVPLAGHSQNQLPPGTEAPPDSSQRAASSALDDAESKIEQHNLQAARPLVQKYLKEHPQDARGLFDLGYLDQAENLQDAAAQDYRRAIAADPKQFESRLALGLMLAQQGKLDEARDQLQKATLLTPSAPNPEAQAQAFRGLAELDRTKDPEAAKDALLSALRLSRETPQDLLLTAQIAEASGDEETAATAYRNLLASKPDSAIASQAAGGLTHLLLKERKYSEAEPLLTSALGRDPDDPALNAQLAATLIAENKSSQALPVLEKLHQLEPNNPSVQQMLADAYSETGHPEKADPIYSQIALAHPNDPEALQAQAKNLMKEQRYSEAQEIFARVLQLKPDDGDSWSGLAFAASENKQYSTALQALSMRAKYLPETSGSYFLWATSYDNLHQPRQAEEYYRKFIAASGGKFPDQEWQAKQRLAVLGRTH